MLIFFIDFLTITSEFFEPGIDPDGSVCKSLEAIKPDIFANGGDRSLEEIPETTVMKKYNIKMVDGLGDKIRSSSDLTGIGK